jgi:ketosteroid isomerase-like protein
MGATLTRHRANGERFGTTGSAILPRAMSHENVELVRRAIEAFNRRDLAALAEVAHDDFEFVSVLTAVDAEGGTYRGSVAWTTYFKDMDEAWKEWRVEDPQVLDGGEDRVAGLFRVVGTGRHSDAQVELSMGLVYVVRDGKLWRMHSYADAAEALKAAGVNQ